MNNQLQIFNNEQFGQVRTLLINNLPHFVGKDVAEALGYTNPRKALIDHVETEDKGVTKCDTLGGTQEMTIINESGLYSLIFGSKLEKAKEFKRWVTSEVLPSIRKTGSYNSNPKGITKERVMAVIETLRDDEYKNEAVAGLLRLIPIEKESIVSISDTGLNLKSLLNEFLQDESVIVKPIEYGLAVDKYKLYDFFKPYGFKRNEILKQLDNANLIFHREGCRTIQVNCGGYPVRVVVIKE